MVYCSVLSGTKKSDIVLSIVGFGCIVLEDKGQKDLFLHLFTVWDEIKDNTTDKTKHIELKI